MCHASSHYACIFATLHVANLHEAENRQAGTASGAGPPARLRPV